MGEALKFILYFLIGGSILTLVTYFGSKDRGIIASFIAMFPLITGLSVITIYQESGTFFVLDYVKGLLILSPLWILFLLCIYYLLPRQGLWIALGAGVVIYLVAAVILIYR